MSKRFGYSLIGFAFGFGLWLSIFLYQYFMAYQCVIISFALAALCIIFSILSFASTKAPDNCLYEISASLSTINILMTVLFIIIIVLVLYVMQVIGNMPAISLIE